MTNGDVILEIYNDLFGERIVNSKTAYHKLCMLFHSDTSKQFSIDKDKIFSIAKKLGIDTNKFDLDGIYGALSREVNKLGEELDGKAKINYDDVIETYSTIESINELKAICKKDLEKFINDNSSTEYLKNRNRKVFEEFETLILFMNDKVGIIKLFDQAKKDIINNVKRQREINIYIDEMDKLLVDVKDKMQFIKDTDKSKSLEDIGNLYNDKYRNKVYVNYITIKLRSIADGINDNKIENIINKAIDEARGITFNKIEDTDSFINKYSEKIKIRKDIFLYYIKILGNNNTNNSKIKESDIDVKKILDCNTVSEAAKVYKELLDKIDELDKKYNTVLSLRKKYHNYLKDINLANIIEKCCSNLINCNIGDIESVRYSCEDKIEHFLWINNRIDAEYDKYKSDDKYSFMMPFIKKQLDVLKRDCIKVSSTIGDMDNRLRIGLDEFLKLVKSEKHKVDKDVSLKKSNLKGKIQGYFAADIFTHEEDIDSINLRIDKFRTYGEFGDFENIIIREQLTKIIIDAFKYLEQIEKSDDFKQYDEKDRKTIRMQIERAYVILTKIYCEIAESKNVSSCKFFNNNLDFISLSDLIKRIFKLTYNNDGYEFNEEILTSIDNEINKDKYDQEAIRAAKRK